MKVNRGDVVFVDYPFSDRTGSKVRPCLVVQNDRNNRRLNDTIVVPITSRKRYAAFEPTQLLIEIATPEGQQSGLLFDSAISCENILTVDNRFLLRRVGSLTPALLQKVAACLQASLDIP